jgi:hypothetical protein
MKTAHFFEITSKRRKGFPSETCVKRGLRIVHGEKEFQEKLGRNDPCPCGSGRSFQKLLPPHWSLRRQFAQPLFARVTVKIFQALNQFAANPAVRRNRPASCWFNRGSNPHSAENRSIGWTGRNPATVRDSKAGAQAQPEVGSVKTREQFSRRRTVVFCLGLPIF